MDIAVKDLWTNLTVVLPGMVTYGTWRLVILVIGYERLDFTAIDSSTVLSLCVLVGISLLQQAFGIFVEAILALVTYANRSAWPTAHRLFVRRFARLARGPERPEVARTVGNFFLSLNTLIGQIFILVFVKYAENPAGSSCTSKPAWLFLALGVVVGVALVVTIFRCWSALEVTRETPSARSAPEQG